MEDLLKYDDHSDVTIVLEDGEIKSNKFILSARSAYFDSMFKGDNFKESDGRVTIPCKKVIMEKVIQYIYGDIFDHSLLSHVEKLELLDIFRMMMLQDAFATLEKYFIQNIVEKIDISGVRPLKTVKDLKYYSDVLDFALSLKLDKISSSIVSRMTTFQFKIIDILTNNDISLPDSVVVALASSKAGEMFKFRLINLFKNSTFAQNPVPKIYLNALTVEQLELEVLPSELYREIDVLKLIIGKQNDQISNQESCIVDQKGQIENLQTKIENLNKNDQTILKQCKSSDVLRIMK